jgi:hypothetical protein
MQSAVNKLCEERNPSGAPILTALLTLLARVSGLRTIRGYQGEPKIGAFRPPVLRVGGKVKSKRRWSAPEASNTFLARNARWC